MTNIKDMIFNDDCLEGMNKMEDNCVDITFTSPPYNDTGKNDGSSKSHKKYLKVETKKDWYEWQIKCIDECLRITKKYVLYNVQGIKNNRRDVYKIIGHYANKIHDILIWNKPSGVPCGNPHKISNRYEFIIIIKKISSMGCDVNSNFYTNVINMNGNRNNDYANIHHAVMPIELALEIVKEFSKPEDIVFDPFMGCGTTAVACKQLGRHYCGFEIEKVYYDKIIDRLKGVSNNGQLSLFDANAKNFNLFEK